MYSLVLATALTAGTAAPDCFFLNLFCGPPCAPVCGPCFRPCAPCFAPCAPCFRPCAPCFAPCAPCPPCFAYCPPPCPPVFYCPPPCPPVVYVWDAPVVPEQPKKPAQPKKKPAKPKEKKELEKQTGTVEVIAPEEVQIAFNGVKIDRKQERQAFDTPALEVGEQFHYVVTATVMRDGKQESLTQTVVVEAGRKARVDFRDIDVALARR